MTSHKPANSQMTIAGNLFEANNSLTHAIHTEFSLFRNSILLPLLTIREKARTAAQHNQQAIVKTLSVLGATSAIVLFVILSQPGAVNAAPAIAIITVAINLLLLVFNYSTSQKSILQQKELLEQKNAALEELVSISKEQREKLKKTVAFKEKLISIISHDIRVPLNSFRFLIENHERGYLTEKMVWDGIIETKKDLIKVDEMVLDLANWSKSEKTDKEKQIVSYQQFHDVMESVLSVYTLSAKNKNLQIVPVIDIPEGMNLSMARRDVEIIMRNLLSNAIKFSNKEGKILLSMKANGNNPTSATLTVRDFGTGMHPAVLEKLNGNRVVSTIGTMNEVGLGVGLSIVFDVIHSGNLTHNIQSEAGKGTSFSVNIPLVSCQSK